MEAYLSFIVSTAHICRTLPFVIFLFLSGALRGSIVDFLLLALFLSLDIIIEEWRCNNII